MTKRDEIAREPGKPMTSEAIEKIVQETHREHPEFTNSDLDLLRRFASRVLEEAAQQWISAKERLPNYGVWVWVVIDGVVQRQAANRDVGEWRWADDDADAAPEDVVTHWMPLQEPPAIRSFSGVAQEEKP